MLLGTSSTQIFYHLLDLDDEQQQKVLDTLKENQPEIHQEITALLGSSPSEHFSDLLGFHAQQTCHFDWNLSNQTIDKYQLQEELGRGGMGVVYSAYRSNGTFEQDLAIKFIQPNINNILDKRALFEEAQLLARLNHPYIAKVFDGGEHQELVYIVMEKVIGVTLNEYLIDNELSKIKKLQLFSQICQALEHAHQHNILHADLKPENILIDDQHSPKLIDFNVTQKVKESTISSQKGLLAFSTLFASPEQKSGGFLTQQSDIYSLGKLLFLLFPTLDANNDINCIQIKSTEESLDKRYRSVLKLRLDIEAIIASRPISLKQHRPCYALKCLLKRKPIPSLLGALLILTGMIFSSLLAFKNHQLEQEKIVAENMMHEVTQLLFHSKGSNVSQTSINAMIELTRRQILSNPSFPAHIKHKILLEINNSLSSKKKTLIALESHETLSEPKFIK